MGRAGPVQWLAGPPGVEPDQVDGGGCGVMFQAGFAQAEGAGAADPGDVGGLGDGALDPRADPVSVPPGVARLLGAGGGEGLLETAGEPSPPGGRGGPRGGPGGPER